MARVVAKKKKAAAAGLVMTMSVKARRESHHTIFL